MRAITWLVLFLAVTGVADEAADRLAVRKTLRSLNIAAERRAQFTVDADGRSQLEAAIHAPRRERPPNEPLSADYWPFWPAYLEEPWPVETISIRFITADVALADCKVRNQPILIILKREGPDWKIAAVRLGQAPLAWTGPEGPAYAGTSTQARFLLLSSSASRIVSWRRPSTNCGYSGSAPGSAIDW